MNALVLVVNEEIEIRTKIKTSICREIKMKIVPLDHVLEGRRPSLKAFKCVSVIYRPRVHCLGLLSFFHFHERRGALWPLRWR